jgi:4-hydroxy-tetrahydrodipicolinate synthase
MRMKQMDVKKLGGVIPALITPFDDDGKLALEHLEKQIYYLCSSEINGLFLSGTTGEGPYLSRDEKLQVLSLVKEIAPKKIKICAACIQPSTRMVIDEIDALDHLEPDFIVSVTPYYYSVSQKEIIEHYSEIARRSPFSVIVYNIPQHTHNSMELKTILDISSIENISGMKDSSGNFSSFTRGIMECKNKSFSWIQGDDYLDGLSLLVGARGIVTGLGNVWIEPYVEMHREAKEDNISKVTKLQGKINRLCEIIERTGGCSTPAIKAACALLGRSTPLMVQRSMTLSEDKIATVEQILKELGLI